MLPSQVAMIAANAVVEFVDYLYDHTNESPSMRREQLLENYDDFIREKAKEKPEPPSNILYITDRRKR